MRIDSFNRRAVRPMACLREGWQLIKDDYWLFLGIIFVGFLVGGMAAAILMGPVLCGIHYCLLRRLRGLGVSFDMLFRGFDYFLPSFVATIILFVPQVILIFTAYGLFVAGMLGTLAAMPKPAPGEGLDPGYIAAFVGMVILYILAIIAISSLPKLLLFFTYTLIVDRNLTGYEAVKLSIRAVFGNLFGVLGVLILGEILAMMGLFLCFVGFYLALPISFAMSAIAYRQVFGVEDVMAEFADDRDVPPREPILVGPVDTGIQGEPERPAVEPGNTGVTA